MAQEWGLPVVSISGAYDPSDLPGFVAEDGCQRLGVITFRLTSSECEVITLNSFQTNNGVGTALLNAVRAIADEQGLRLWLITTTENVGAIRFYEKRGMTRRSLHRDFVSRVRLHKPASLSEASDAAYRDAIEFSY